MNVNDYFHLLEFNDPVDVIIHLWVKKIMRKDRFEKDLGMRVTLNILLQLKDFQISLSVFKCLGP